MIYMFIVFLYHLGVWQKIKFVNYEDNLIMDEKNSLSKDY